MIEHVPVPSGWLIIDADDTTHYVRHLSHTTVFVVVDRLRWSSLYPPEASVTLKFLTGADLLIVDQQTIYGDKYLSDSAMARDLYALAEQYRASSDDELLAMLMETQL